MDWFLSVIGQFGLWVESLWAINGIGQLVLNAVTSIPNSLSQLILLMRDYSF